MEFPEGFRDEKEIVKCMRLSRKELNYCIRDVFVTTEVFEKIVETEMERSKKEMENVIYKGFIERQIIAESELWFHLEDAKIVKILSPDLINVTDNTLTYKVIVLFIPANSKKTEGAVLTVLLNSHGANVMREERTDTEEENHD